MTQVLTPQSAAIEAINGTNQKILNLLQAAPLTAVEVAQRSGRHVSPVYRNLSRLIIIGAVMRVTENKKTKYKAMRRFVNIVEPPKSLSVGKPAFMTALGL